MPQFSAIWCIPVRQDRSDRVTFCAAVRELIGEDTALEANAHLVTIDVLNQQIDGLRRVPTDLRPGAPDLQERRTRDLGVRNNSALDCTATA